MPELTPVIGEAAIDTETGRTVWWDGYGWSYKPPDAAPNAAPPARNTSLPPLVAQKRPSNIPLSFAQARLWLLDQLGETSTEYNMPEMVRLRGELDLKALQKTIAAIVQRHESLRTHFASINGEPVQIVESEKRIDLPIEDLSNCDEADRQQRITEALRQEWVRPFDLSRGPVFRMKLIRLAAEDHILLRTFHHIVSDGWSQGVFNREFMLFYQAFHEGREPELKPLSIQYADFALWQRLWLDDAVLRPHLEYWKQHLADIPEQLGLPHDRPRDSGHIHAAGLFQTVLPPERVTALQQAGAQNHATLYMLLLAAYAVLLHRYSRQDDIVIGCPIANRQEPQLEELIGFFVNALPMRVTIKPRASIRELLADVRSDMLEAYLHQDLPFERLVEELSPHRSLVQSPIFQVSLTLQNTPIVAQKLQDLEVESERIRGETLRARFELELHAWHRDGAIDLLWVYSRHMFDSWRIEQMARHYLRILNTVISASEQPICEIDLLNEREKHQLLIEWNLSVAATAAHTTIPEWFDEQVARSPHAAAVTFEHQQLSYAELNHRANQLAHYLRGAGVSPETRVGICVERGMEMIVGILGVLKAGGAYVPLDPGHPTERLAYVMADAGITLLLTLRRLQQILPQNVARLVFVDDGNTFSHQPNTALRTPVNPENTAYVIYTSGSTGKPKGVEITHSNVIRLLEKTQPWFAFTHRDVWTLFHSFAFDFSVWEIWGALLYGGRLVVVPHWVSRSPEEFLELLIREKVTVLNQTPSAFQHLARARESMSGDDELNLRVVIFGGEALEFQSLSSWTQRYGTDQPQLINMYGITETTVHVTYYRVAPPDLTGTASRIGVPIPDLCTYVLDEFMRPAPIGVAGELYVGGAGLARGYLNRPELTAERFVPSPFSRIPGARLYRTGDLARYRPDGILEYLGRIDHQVKIRGYRIELGEIEAALKANPRVQDALVILREHAGERQLIGYVLARSAEAAPDEVKSHILHWQQLYDSTYAQGVPSSPDFNITGWNSSYTGEPIPAEEMRIWVEETVAHIHSLQPRRVLEVGCGTGLLLTRLAPACESYTGLDFSAAALEQLKPYLSQREDLRHVVLRQSAAHELAFLADSSVDLVILNSVVQYFPSMEYLIQVLQEAVRVTRPGGHIFLGDLRSLPLLEAYHTSVQLYRANPSNTLDELRQSITQARQAEEELLVDPALFDDLSQRWEKIGRWQFGPKAGAYDNELSRFRYDVILSLEMKQTIKEPEEWLPWDASGQWLCAAEERYLGRPQTSFGVRAISDGRVASAMEAVRLLRASDQNHANIEQVREACLSATGEEPNRLIKLAQRLGAKLCWQVSSIPGVYHAVFNPQWEAQPRRDIELSSHYSRYGNAPAQRDEHVILSRRLRDCLRQTLPDYMVPSAIVVLAAWPLTANGKIDRQALPLPERHAGVHQAPRTPTEELLVPIWADVLGLEQIDVHGNFFELGGHSLLAARLISRMRDKLRLEIPLRRLFERPTIAGLASCIDGNELKQRELSAIEIVARNEEGSGLPLSFNQEAALLRDWWAGLRGIRTPPFHMALVLSLKGILEVQALEDTLRAIVARHEVLRSSFSVPDRKVPLRELSAVLDQPSARKNGKPPSLLFKQTLHRDVSLSLVIKDLEGFRPDQQEEQVSAIFIEESCRSFHYEMPPLMRVVLIRKNAAEHLLVLVAHHLLSDGWSLQILQKEVAAFYQQFRGKSEQGLAPLSIHYADFANWQRSRLSDGTFDELTSYWKDQWQQFPALDIHELPFIRSNLSAKGAHSQVESLVLNAAAYKSMKDFAQQRSVTLYMLLLAALNIVLHLYTGKEKIAVWGNFANRTRSEFDNLIGWFANSHILGLSVASAAPIAEFLEQVREAVIEATARQALPNGLLWTNVLQDLGGSHSRRRVFDGSHIFFDVTNESPGLSCSGLTIEPVAPPTTRNAEHPLYVMGSIRPSEMMITIRYSPNNFDGAGIRTLLADLRTVLEHMIASPQSLISALHPKVHFSLSPSGAA